MEQKTKMTAQEIDRIECAIRHIESSLDVDPWAAEIAVEAMKTQLSAEGTTSDLISRQDAVEVIEEMQMPIMRSMFPEEQFVFKGMSEALSAIKDLPSAHPEIEERKGESAQNVPKEDLISRKEAIDAVDSETVSTNPEHFKSSEKFIKFMDDADISSFGKWQWSNGFNTALVATTIQLKKLPSAQPESCEDAVSRDSVKFLLCKETCHPGAFCPDGFCREICEKVDALPSATPKQRMGEWIPVSERLPEDLGDYLVSIKRIGWNMEEYVENDIAYWDDLEGFHKADEVLAWMPLPEPYRAERRTDDANDIT